MITRIAILVTAGALIAVPASAQNAGTVELGLDAGVSIGLGDNSSTVIRFPVQAFRAGFFGSRTLSLEPKVGLTTLTGDGGFTAYNAELGILFHYYGRHRYDLFPRRMPYSAVYLRPFAGIQGVSNDDGPDTKSETLGAGVGVKFPLANRLASRFEVNFAHHFVNDDTFGEGEGFNVLGLLAGLSFFFR
ncbi:MAG TPA: hypothetical protein VM099_03830 [Gemmatimonadaceae bacterium]|nr:hypothetical protein [Gemmatimonadaceae bacterium]